MLRDPLPTKQQKDDYWRSWSINNHPEITTINRIENFAGEIIMTDDPSHDGVMDPGIPIGMSGSHYYLSQRMLDSGSFENNWMNQIAYSYFTPQLAIRTKSGLEASYPNRWTVWEYTIMSGLLTHTINYNGGTFVIQRHRNSRVCYVGLYNLYIDIEHTGSPITIGNLPTSFCPRPSVTMDYTIRMQTNAGEAIAIMGIEANGNVHFRSDYIGRIIPQSLVVFINDIDI